MNTDNNLMTTLKALMLIGSLFLILQLPTEAINSDVKVEKKILYATDKEQDKEGIITKTFTISNSGNELVEIVNVNPHCSCTGYKLSKESIGPNEKIELTLSVPYSQLELLKKTHAVITTNGSPKLLLASIYLKEESEEND